MNNGNSKPSSSSSSALRDSNLSEYIGHLDAFISATRAIQASAAVGNNANFSMPLSSLHRQLLQVRGIMLGLWAPSKEDQQRMSAGSATATALISKSTNNISATNAIAKRSVTQPISISRSAPTSVVSSAVSSTASSPISLTFAEDTAVVAAQFDAFFPLPPPSPEEAIIEKRASLSRSASASASLSPLRKPPPPPFPRSAPPPPPPPAPPANSSNSHQSTAALRSTTALNNNLRSNNAIEDSNADGRVPSATVQRRRSRSRRRATAPAVPSSIGAAVAASSAIQPHLLPLDKDEQQSDLAIVEELQQVRALVGRLEKRLSNSNGRFSQYN